MTNQPRKQPRQERSRATRAAILEAAARILEQEGRDSLTTNRIAVRAGVSIGSLYQYFPNKAAILASLLRDTRAGLLDDMRAVLRTSGGQSPEDVVDALIRAGMTHQFSRPRLALELEHAEKDLALDAETHAMAYEIAALVLSACRRIAPDANLRESADVVAICKGLINATALSGGPCGADLFRRCRTAALGYLREHDAASQRRSGRFTAAGSR
ncbi:TetR/AcrR family transcriptional regulator [Sulfitobacter sp. LCG007]